VTIEPDLKQKEKDEALQRRKEELEDELDRYARAGAFSPGLIKVTRWLSRGLYLAMAVAFMAMLFSGWGKVSQEEFDRVHDGYTKWKDEAGKEKTAREEAQNAVVQAEIKAAKLKLELEGQQGGLAVEQADAAQKHARDLIERAWGERAYAEHWRQKLAAATPERDRRAEVANLIEQAASAPAGERFELMRETAEFGVDAVEKGCAAVLTTDRPESRKIAVRLMSRAGKPIDPRGSGESDVGVLREMWFCYSVAGVSVETSDIYLGERFVGLALAMNPRMDELKQAYRVAPEQNRIELLALLAECASGQDSGVMEMVAMSERPLAEKIIAVRWMGRNGSSRALLETLGERQGVLAEEAKKALK
jgi:hypothetical protein